MSSPAHDDNRVPPVFVYKGQACLHCFQEGLDAPLKRCSGCFYVFYCGHQCQRASWPKHKELCKAFRFMNQEFRFDIYTPFVFIREDVPFLTPLENTTHMCTDVKRMNKTVGVVAASQIACLEERLGTTLCSHGRNIIEHEPRCLSCARSEAMFKMGEAMGVNGSPAKPGLQYLKPCPDCRLSFYCSKQCWKAVKYRHQSEPCEGGRGKLSQCKMNQLYAEDSRLAWLMSGFDRSPFKWAPERIINSWSSLRDVTWSDFAPEVKAAFGGVQETQKSLGAVFRGITEALSMPMTILWGLENLNPNDAWTKKDILDIHILGPAEKEVKNLFVFEEILHRLPLVNTLRLTFCGPELVQDSGESPSSGMVLDGCSQCEETRRRIFCSYHIMTYHEFISSEGASFTVPDLAVAFNSGCSQKDAESWGTTLGAMMERKIPGLFTAHKEEEARADVKILTDAGATLHPQLGPRRNVWGSLVSRIEPRRVTGFIATNEWLVGGFQ